MIGMSASFIAHLLREIERATTGRRLDRVVASTADRIRIVLRRTDDAIVFDAGAIAPRVGWEERGRGGSGARGGDRDAASVRDSAGAYVRSDISTARLATLAEALLSGRELERIEQPDGDRWVHLDFGDGKRLVWEHFGRRANVVLVENGTIVACLRTYAPGEPGVKRPIVVGAPYPAPPAGHAEDTAEAPAESAAPCIVHLAERGAPRLSHFAPDDAALERAGIARARIAGARVERFPSFALASAAWGVAMVARDAHARLLVALRAHWRDAERRARRALDAIDRDLARADRSDEFRRAGEALVASFALLRRGASEARVPDPHDAATTLVIPLDPAKTPQENADRFFKDAKRGARGRATMVARRETVGADHARAEEAAARWADDAGDAATIDEMAAAARAAGLRIEGIGARGDGPRARAGRGAGARGGAGAQGGGGAGARGSAGAGEPSRGPGGRRRDSRHDPLFGARLYRYEVTGGFTVLVGRADSDNDLLTHKIARPWDLWFHSGQSAGSHVVLVKGSAKASPPKEALLEAAALAAHYSKARNAGLVPVIYTERRYVRKPRRAPAGLVTCEREKTIFVRPDALEAKRGKSGGREPLTELDAE